MPGSLPQPGWYPDPIEPGWVRWWDGEVWTAHRQVDPEIVDEQDEDEDDGDEDDRFFFELDADDDGHGPDDVATTADDGDGDTGDEDAAVSDEQWVAAAESAHPRLEPLAPEQRQRRARIAAGLMVLGVAILAIVFVMARDAGGDGADIAADAPGQLAAPGPDWVTYTHPTGWTITHPPGWTTVPQPVTVYVFIDQNNPPSGRNINVQRTTVAAGMSLERFAAANRRTFADAGRDVAVLGEGEGTLGGNPAHRFVIEGDLGDGRVRLLSVVTIIERTAYIVTFTSVVDGFDSALPDVERVLAAMKLVP